MALGMTVTCVFAAGEGSITVSNTTTGKTYTAYKVFDAAYNGTDVSYTYDGSNAEFLAALQAATTLFTVTEITSRIYNVTDEPNPVRIRRKAMY